METKAGEGINRKRSRGSAGKDSGWRQKNEVSALESLSHTRSRTAENRLTALLPTLIQLPFDGSAVRNPKSRLSC